MVEKRGSGAKILVGSDHSQENTAKSLIQYFPKELAYSFTYINLKDEEPRNINDNIDTSDLFLCMTLRFVPISALMARSLSPLWNKKWLSTHWKKSVLLREYGEFFKEAFAEDINVISARNEKISQAAVTSGYYPMPAPMLMYGRDLTRARTAGALHPWSGDWAISFEGDWPWTIARHIPL